MDQEIWISRILLKHVTDVPWLEDEVTAAIHPIAWKLLFQKI